MQQKSHVAFRTVLVYTDERMSKDRERFSVALPDDLASKIREIAEREERSLSKVISMLLRKVLMDGEEKSPGPK